MTNTVLRIAMREWKWILENHRKFYLVLVAPLVCVAILGFVYSPKKVMGVPVLIVDQDHSALSRELSRAILASETFSLGGYSDSSEEFPALVAQDRVHLCLIFPHNLEKDVRARREAKVQVILDASNILSGNAQAMSASNVLATFAVGVEVRTIEGETGIPGALAVNHAMPIETGMRAWFNPGFSSNYLNFLMIGLLTIYVQLAGLVVSAGAGVHEYRETRGNALAALTRNPWAFVAGKVLAYVAVIYPISMIVVYMPHLFFGAPMRGSQVTLALVTLWFTAMLVTVGYALSCVLADELFATEICALITLPNFLLSGFTWPIFAMPPLLRGLAYGLPMYSYSFIYRKLSVMGASAEDCLRQMTILSLWTVLAALFARYGTKQIVKANREVEHAHA
jgi:ABC-2 type transport system permease protein